MKVLMLTCSPQELVKILNGDKSLIIRKKFHKDYVGWVYIYCTKGKYQMGKFGDGLYHEETNDSHWANGCTWNLPKHYLNGKVVARFWCNKVEEIEINFDFETLSFSTNTMNEEEILEKSCLSGDELGNYLLRLGNLKGGYAIHITKLEIFDKPKEISEFHKIGYDEAYDLVSLGWDSEECLDYHKSIEVLDKQYKLIKAPGNWCYVEI